MNRLDRLREQEDTGFSLVELLVTLVITSVVLAMAGTFFANVARVTTWSGRDRDAMGNASLALDEIRTVVRVAVDNPTSPTSTDPAVVAADGTDLTVTAYSNTTNSVDASPVQVAFRIEQGYLNEYRQASTKSSDGYWQFGGPWSSRRIAGPFDTAPQTPFFTYLDGSGSLVGNPGSVLSPTQRQTVAFVRVTATVANTNLKGDPDPVIVTSSIGMPNVSRDVSSNITVPTLPPPPPPPTPTPTPTPTATQSTAPTTAPTSETPTTAPTSETPTTTPTSDTPTTTPTTGTPTPTPTTETPTPTPTPTSESPTTTPTSSTPTTPPVTPTPKPTRVYG